MGSFVLNGSLSKAVALPVACIRLESSLCLSGLNRGNTPTLILRDIDETIYKSNWLLVFMIE